MLTLASGPGSDTYFLLDMPLQYTELLDFPRYGLLYSGKRGKRTVGI